MTAGAAGSGTSPHSRCRSCSPRVAEVGETAQDSVSGMEASLFLCLSARL